MQQVKGAKHLMVKLRDEPGLDEWTADIVQKVDRYVSEVFDDDPKAGQLCSAFIQSAGDVLWAARREGRPHGWGALDVDCWLDGWAQSAGFDDEFLLLALVSLRGFYANLVGHGELTLEDSAAVTGYLDALIDRPPLLVEATEAPNRATRRALASMRRRSMRSVN